MWSLVVWSLGTLSPRVEMNEDGEGVEGLFVTGSRLSLRISEHDKL